MTTTTPNVAATISEAYRRAQETYTTNDAHEITEEVYFEALEVLPPVYGHGTDTQCGRFWVGEPYTHSARGFEVLLECWQERRTKAPGPLGTGRFFCRLSEHD